MGEKGGSAGRERAGDQGGMGSSEVEVLTYKLRSGTPLPRAVREMLVMANANRKPVEAVFSGVKIVANPDDSPEAVVASYDEELARQAEAYRKSGSGKDVGDQEVGVDIRQTSLPTFSFRDSEATADWERLLAESQSEYRMGTIACAAHLASLIEEGLASGADFEEAAKRASQEVSNRVRGVSGLMVTDAVTILSGVWEHGKRLLRWYNS